MPEGDTVSLREYVEARFADQQRAIDLARDAHRESAERQMAHVYDRLTERLDSAAAFNHQYATSIDARFDASDKALILALEELQRRLDLLNEFRGQAEAQQKDFLRREVFDQALERVASDIASLDRRATTTEGETRGRKDENTIHTGQVVAIVAVLGLLLSAVVIVVNVLLT